MGAGDSREAGELEQRLARRKEGLSQEAGQAGRGHTNLREKLGFFPRVPRSHAGSEHHGRG